MDSGGGMLDKHEDRVPYNDGGLSKKKVLEKISVRTDKQALYNSYYSKNRPVLDV
jgi:hypothetical protein